MIDLLILSAGARHESSVDRFRWSRARLAWKLAASPLLEKLYCAPGNPGIAAVAELADIGVDDHAALIAFAKEKSISTSWSWGRKRRLSPGLPDEMRALRHPRLLAPSGPQPSLKARRASPSDLCARFNIPTGAAGGRFNSAPKAKAYIRQAGRAHRWSRPMGLPQAGAWLPPMTLQEAR